jgi:hypothetical protein
VLLSTFYLVLGAEKLEGEFTNTNTDGREREKKGGRQELHTSGKNWQTKPYPFH